MTQRSQRNTKAIGCALQKKAPAPSGTGALRATLECRELGILAVAGERPVPQNGATTATDGIAAQNTVVRFAPVN